VAHDILKTENPA